MMFLPANTSHLFQPLDQFTFGTFKKVLGFQQDRLKQAALAFDEEDRTTTAAASYLAEGSAFTADNIKASWTVTGLIDYDLTKADRQTRFNEAKMREILAKNVGAELKYIQDVKAGETFVVVAKCLDQQLGVHKRRRKEAAAMVTPITMEMRDIKLNHIHHASNIIAHREFNLKCTAEEQQLKAGEKAWKEEEKRNKAREGAEKAERKARTECQAARCHSKPNKKSRINEAGGWHGCACKEYFLCTKHNIEENLAYFRKYHLPRCKGCRRPADEPAPATDTPTPAAASPTASTTSTLH